MDDNIGIGVAVLGIIAAIAIASGLVIFGSTCGACTSAATAPSRVISKTLETNNIIHNYEWFFDVNAQFKARVAQITGHRAAIADETDARELRRLKTELRGMRQVCRELANEYNANSQKANRNIFKRGVPERLDAGRCEE